MNQDQVKELLKKLDCRLPGGIKITAEEIPDFKLSFTGRSNKKCDGLYRTHNSVSEIVIHNLNHSSDKRLINTAIHEFAHHIHFTCFPNFPETVAAGHNKVFKAIYQALLNDAILKNLHRPKFLYDAKYNQDSELQKGINEAIEKYQTAAKELSDKLQEAFYECSIDGVDFQEFIESQSGITISEYKRLKKQVSSISEKVNIFQSEQLSKIRNIDIYNCAKDMYVRNTPKATVEFSVDEPLQEVCRMSRKTYLKEVYESKKLRAEKLGGQLLLIGEELTTIVEKEKCHDSDSVSPELVRAS